MPAITTSVLHSHDPLVQALERMSLEDLALLIIALRREKERLDADNGKNSLPNIDGD